MNHFKIKIWNFKKFSCISCISNLVPVYKSFIFDFLYAIFSASYSDGG